MMSRLLILLAFVAIAAALPYPDSDTISFESPPADNEKPEELAERHRRPNYGYGQYGYNSYNNYYYRPSYGGYGYNNYYNRPSYGYGSYSNPYYNSYGSNYNNYNSYGGYNNGYYNNYYSGYNNYGYSGYGSGNYLGWREGTKSSATASAAAAVQPATGSSSSGVDSTAVKFE